MNKNIITLFGSIVMSMFLLSPLSVEAKLSTLWNFGENLTEQQWMTNANINMTQTEDGLRFVTESEEAAIRKNLKETHAIDVLYITYTSPKTFEMKVAWIPSGSEEGGIYLFPILFAKSDTPVRAGVDVSSINKWDRTPQSIGLSFLPGTDVTIQSIEAVAFNPAEKFLELLKGFWTFDVYRPSSVNFVWGPRLVLNPVARVNMYLMQPPSNHSFNSVFYVVAAVGLLLVWWKGKTKRWQKRKALLTCSLLIGSLWVLYDMRMGSEFLHYLYSDYSSYYSKELGVRTFRERLFFNDFAEAIAPIVADRTSYIFLAEDDWPYTGLMKYITYPSTPTHPYGGNANVIDTWIVYRRSDITMNEENRLILNGQILSPHGEMLHEFDTGTFIFRSLL
jgi:hypothetical protein